LNLYSIYVLKMVQGDHKDWERFGRASKESAPEIVELNTIRSNPEPFDVASYYCQILIHRAHTIMLAEEGLIKKDEACEIIKGLRVVEEEAMHDTRLVGYMSTETALIEKIGEVGGKMHIGRSRNDLGHTQRRMYYRDKINQVISVIIDFRESLVEASQKYIETWMPGYTHWRQAQPITLGHYLMAHVEAASRTIRLLESIYDLTNLSPLGSAAFAGTGWPVNRKRTMELLGFNGLIENTLDGVAAIDYYMELGAVLAVHMSNLSRLAEDIQIWSSDEFKLIELDEAYAGTSSIMPQKKNPLVLEQVKSYAAESIGGMDSTIISMKGTSYTNIVDRVMLEPTLIETVKGSTRIMAGVVKTMTPLNENMLKILREGYSTVTDLADTLVRLFNLSFRQAHDVVVQVTLDAINKNLPVDEITSLMVEEASLKVLGKPLTLPEEYIHESLDPILNVKRRKGIGGPAPESVQSMINGQKTMLKEEKSRHTERVSKVESAKIKLSNAEERLMC
jgi:argininosuccinate lyase